MVEWHHWLSGCEFEHTQGDSEGQESLARSSSGACKELDPTEWLNDNKSSIIYILVYNVLNLSVILYIYKFINSVIFIYNFFQETILQLT